MSKPDLEEVRRVMAEADCLSDEDAIEAALDEMALGIATRLQHSDPLI